jgi:hypothetical protein
MAFSIIIVLFNVYFLISGIKSFWRKNKTLNNKDIIILQRLFLYHQGISLIFSYYVLKFGGDATLYWFIYDKSMLSRPWFYYYGTGTNFMYFINYWLVKFFNINFYAGALMYGFIGYLGFVYLYLIIRKFTKGKIKFYSFNIFPLLLFLPNLNFWSSGIGKDSLIFFGIVLFLYCLFNYKQKIFTATFALVLIFYIRPHILLFLIISLFLAIILDSKLKIGHKIFMLITIISISSFTLNKVLEVTQIKELNSQSIERFSETRATRLTEGAGSGINTNNYSLPLKIFTFLYRPLFFDINGPLAIVASVENLLLLWLSLLFLFKLKPFRVFVAAPFQFKVVILFFLISSVVFSMTLGNLGIMLRAKIMVIPSFLVFIFWSVEYLNHQKLKKKIKIVIQNV